MDHHLSEDEAKSEYLHFKKVNPEESSLVIEEVSDMIWEEFARNYRVDYNEADDKDCRSQVMESFYMHPVKDEFYTNQIPSIVSPNLSELALTVKLCEHEATTCTVVDKHPEGDPNDISRDVVNHDTGVNIQNVVAKDQDRLRCHLYVS